MRKLYLSVKTNARENRVIPVDDAHFQVRVKSPPVEGRANENVIEALSDYFGFPKSRFAVIAGHKSKKKIVAVEEPQTQRS